MTTNTSKAYLRDFHDLLPELVINTAKKKKKKKKRVGLSSNLPIAQGSSDLSSHPRPHLTLHGFHFHACAWREAKDLLQLEGLGM